MSIQYTSVANYLPEAKMRLYPTQVINVIGGPGCDKSLITSAIIVFLKLREKTIEVIPDFAKSLVWQQNFEMLSLLDGQVQFLITECSLPQVLFYNENYLDNICDIEKTRKQILEWYNQCNNINIFVERGDRKYIRTGRFQDEEQARTIDRGMRELLDREALPYTVLPSDVTAVNAFAATLI